MQLRGGPQAGIWLRRRGWGCSRLAIAHWVSSESVEVRDGCPHTGQGARGQGTMPPGVRFQLSPDKRYSQLVAPAQVPEGFAGCGILVFISQALRCYHETVPPFNSWDSFLRTGPNPPDKVFDTGNKVLL